MIEKRLPKIFVNNTTPGAKNGAIVALNTLKGLIIASVTGGLIWFPTLIISLLSIINSMQIIYHLPLLEIMLPQNLEIVFSIILPIVQFDIFDFSNVAEDISQNIESIQDKNKIPRRRRNLFIPG